MTTRRLRIAHLMVQPVLVWDDGTELTEGPPVGAITLPLSQVPDMLAKLPAEVERLALEAAVAEPQEQPAPTAR